MNGVERVLIFGSGQRGEEVYYPWISHTRTEVLAYVDNDEKKIGKLLHGIKIVSLQDVHKFDFDKIIVAVASPYKQKEMIDQLYGINVSSDCIINILKDVKYMDLFVDQRINFIEGFANWLNENDLLVGNSVAECGVNKGDSARFINKYFPNSTLYLFDTFDGFDERDLDKEDLLNNPLWKRERFDCEKSKKNYGNIDVEYVVSRMPYADRIVIKKGYFPDTAQGIEDSFSFVNLDMDLYRPMLEGLRFFYDRVVQGGGILLHDYYNADLGVKKAVEDFEKERKISLIKIPIGDMCSLFVLKK